jgi:hypothetical protein
MVDLKSMSTSMEKKSPKTKTAKHKKDKEKQEDSAKKTKPTPKKKATFELAKPEEAGKKKNKEEVAVCFKYVVGFAIRVDKGNNTKGGFDKKISERLTFLREYCDNIHPWISTTGDLEFSHQQEFTVLNSQKVFRGSLPEISLFSLSSLFY